jgi:hypothetical protein
MAPFITTIPIAKILYGSIYRVRKSEIVPAAAANVVYLQSGKRLKKLFGGHQYTVERMNCVGLNFP